MVDQKTSIVTPERFAAGFTYAGFLAQAEKNLDRFQFNYDHTQVTEQDQRAFQELAARPSGPRKVLVLGEDWCPDVYRGLPVIARIAEAAGFELRVFPRDKNLDIMNEFLKNGEFQSIPVAVFYTGDLRYIYHFTERPEKADAEMDQLQALYADRTREEARPDVDRFQQGPVWAGWRQATIAEILANLRARAE
jgi:thiol-disulfide isomerase/thioredoxin